MEKYIKKSDLVAEIEGRIKEHHSGYLVCLKDILSFIDTLEVKDANEALRMEYEKGRADVIAKTLQWLHDLNQEHEIMSYTDSHVLSSEELQQYYKNNIEL